MYSSRVRRFFRVQGALRFAASAALAASAGLIGSLGCSKIDVGIDEPKEIPFEVQLHVTSDPGKAVAGAQVLSGTKIVGKTDAAGASKVRFGGKEGDQVELTIKCPADFDSPPKPLAISLRRLAAGSRPPQFEARCAPTVRMVVVGVKADNGANLPVLYLGRPLGRTDASGAAIFTMKVKPAEQIELTVSTAEKGSEQLRPQSPTLTFVAPDKDDFVVLDQRFTIEKKPVVYRPRPKDNRPTPL